MAAILWLLVKTPDQQGNRNGTDKPFKLSLVILWLCECLRDAIERVGSFRKGGQLMHSPVMEALVWARVPGDMVFSIDVFTPVWFAIRAFVLGYKTKALVVATKFRI